MNKKESISAIDFAFIIFGSIVGSSMLKLPNDLIPIAKQDSWISTLIGGLYPLYIILIGNYIINKHPNNTLLSISKKYLGKFIGTLFNILFLLECTFLLVTLACNLKDISNIFIVDFLSSFKILLISIFLAAYTAYKGLAVVGKINKLTFFFNCFFSCFFFNCISLW